jgi:hypothetical protein
MLVAPGALASAEWVIFQGRSTKDPNIQLIVTGSPQGGSSAVLWKGDYLWARCSVRSGKGQFDCGSRTVHWNPRQGIARLSRNGANPETLRTVHFTRMR